MTTITPWNRRRFLLAQAAALGGAASWGAFAQGGYPERPLRIVVPYSAGGNTDTITREVARGLAERLGQQVLILNKPGANGILGSDFAAKAEPDGYTLLVAIGAYANNPSLYTNLPYGPQDLAPVSLLTRTSLVVATALPGVKSVADLVRESARLNASGNGLTFASSGVGSAAHLLGERFARDLGLKSALHVPYKGTADALGDLVSARVSFMFDAVSALGPHFKSGRLTPLAVTDEQRSTLLPDVPTLNELGHPDLAASAWAALLAPARTPPAVIERLSAECAKVLADPALRARLANIATVPVGSTPEQLGAFIAREARLNGEVIRRLGLRMEMK